MILQDINVGTIANDGTGDNPRAGAIKINANNALIAAALSGAVAGSGLAGTEKLLGLDDSTNKAWLVSQLATYITSLIVDSAPSTLDTLNELAASLGDDPSYAASVAIALAGKQPVDSDLTAIAALSTTSWGRSLLTLADPAAMRALIGGSYILAQSSVAVSHTGDTSEHGFATVSVPAGAIGANGSMEIFSLWSYPNSVNNKTLKTKLGGTTIGTQLETAAQSTVMMVHIGNRGSQSSQIANPAQFSTSTAAVVATSIDTSIAQDITLTGQLASPGETLKLESYLIRIHPGA
ncbi:MAG: hypothetical protein JHD35_16330 [Sphingopyxis sp.]|nr:hypothetical protein [Sphingopyxis sp.]